MISFNGLFDSGLRDIMFLLDGLDRNPFDLDGEFGTEIGSAAGPLAWTVILPCDEYADSSVGGSGCDSSI
jgi:hypothetical protein